MKIQSIYSTPAANGNFAGRKASQTPKEIAKKPIQREVSTNGMNGESIVMEGNASKYFELDKNLSNPKVGTKFLVRPKSAKYKNLTLLITPDTTIKSDDMYIGIAKAGENSPSFKGRLYGSIREENGNSDGKMMCEYGRFWTNGMHKTVTKKYSDKEYAPHLTNDYNFFVPSDGDGTRYRDITALQGGVTKPASYIPATMNNRPMSLVQTVITNFTTTGKLDDGYEFVKVEPAQGSAFAFLEGLKNGQISPDKPIVFSWGDNFTDVNVSKIMKQHEDSGSGFTITTIPVDKEKTRSLSVVKINSLESKTIEKFEEKPKDQEFIDSCVVPELGEDKCLAVVGPYVLSSPALHWIKDNYTADPDSFRNPDKGFDFSSMIIAPILNAMNNGEIVNEDNEPLGMKLAVISDEETWSDLGSQKDFSIAMNQIKKGKYANMPAEMLTSMQQNVDEDGNITFNKRTRTLFDSMKEELNLDVHNVIAYCN